MSFIPSKAYELANAQPNKLPIVVLKMEGIPFYIGSGTIYETVKYDDPEVIYNGEYNYDGLKPISKDNQKSWIDRKGSFSTISQKLEQWDGKASIETFSLKLIDYEQTLTKYFSPGHIIEDIINRKVEIYYGFQTISFPEDYLLLFKGYVNNIKIGQGFVNLLFTDPSSKRKQTVFNGSTTRLVDALTDSATALKITSTENLYRTILNAKGVNDSTVTIGLVLDNKEIITYQNADIIDGQNLNVLRGQFGTTAVAHDADIEIVPFIHLHDNPISIALKAQLSGWGGPFLSGIALAGINNTGVSIVPDSITFESGVHLFRDYGLTTGNFITLSGSAIPANNNTFTISQISDDGLTAIVQEKGILIQENLGTPTLAAFRSKYDVYPITAGLSLIPDDVLVSAFEYNRQTFIQYKYKMDVIGAEKSGKDWIESKLLKTIGGYSLTQGSRISMGLTHPPLAKDLTKFLTSENLINVKDIEVERGLNTRFFYNSIVFKYDYNAIKKEFYRELRIIDADAIKRMRQVSVLEIEIPGLDDSPESVEIMKSRANRILQRHRFSTETITVQTFFGTGHTVDAGDTIVLSEKTGAAQVSIANTETGERGIENRIMEVQERSVDISGSKTTMKLLSNSGYSFSDRYAVFAPASSLDDSFAHSSTQIKIKDDAEGEFPNAEFLKWIDYQGSTIRVHNKDFTLDAESVYTLDLSNPYIVNLNPALPFTPTAGMTMQFAKYDASSAAINSIVKSTFAHWDSSASIFSGTSSTVFALDSGFSPRYKAGMVVYVMSPDGSRYSEDLKIVDITGDIVTLGPVFSGSLNQDLGFIPQSGDIMQLGGFLDDGAGYRMI